MNVLADDDDGCGEYLAGENVVPGGAEGGGGGGGGGAGEFPTIDARAGAGAGADGGALVGAGGIMLGVADLGVATELLRFEAIAAAAAAAMGLPEVEAAAAGFDDGMAPSPTTLPVCSGTLLSTVWTFLSFAPF